jgi:hypothetical protein
MRNHARRQRKPAQTIGSLNAKNQAKTQPPSPALQFVFTPATLTRQQSTTPSAPAAEIPRFIEHSDRPRIIYFSKTNPSIASSYERHRDHDGRKPRHLDDRAIANPLLP